MPLVLVPFLAQVLSASVGDRAELRYLDEPSDQRLEAEDRAFATVGLAFDFAKLSLTYSPSLLVSPLERSEREVLLQHSLTGTVDTGAGIPLYRTERTTLYLQLGANYTQEDVRRQALGAPVPSAAPTPAAPATPPATDPNANPPGATPAPTTPATPAEASPGSNNDALLAGGGTTFIATGRAGLTLQHRLTRRSTVAASSGYTVSSGLGERSRRLFPFVHGPDATGVFTHLLTKKDTLSTQLSARLTLVPSRDSRAWEGNSSQGLLHRFTSRTSGEVVVGVAYTRTEDPVTPPREGISPTASATLTHTRPLATGTLTLQLAVSYAPTLDRSTLVFDRRLNVLGNASWSRRRLTLYATTGTVLSAEPEDQSGLSSVNAGAGASYFLGSGFTLDGGVRAAWQSFGAVETIPPSWSLFAGLTWQANLL